MCFVHTKCLSILVTLIALQHMTYAENRLVGRTQETPPTSGYQQNKTMRKVRLLVSGRDYRNLLHRGKVSH